MASPNPVVKRQLVLIDGNAIVHRAYHALPPLTNRSGELLNAVYGFCTMLFKVISDFQPKFLIVVFDTPKPTFRHKEFIGYQAHRPVMEAELAGQFNRVREVLEAMGIPVLAKEGFEADDVIGTLARQAVRAKSKRVKECKNVRAKKKTPTLIDEVIIVTGDRDLFQLVEPKVKVYAPVKGLTEAQLFNEKAVFEKMGVKPEQIVDYKGLAGDASDNYPGVPGIGPKTAITLLKEFNTLERIYKNLVRVKQLFGETVTEKLKQGEGSARLSQKLAKIETDTPLDLDWQKCAFEFSETEKEKTITKLRELNFKSLAERLGGKKKQKQLGLLS